nr:ribonuclease H-like domain-containing protein [Tanacetum cinerariifolium]
MSKILKPICIGNLENSHLRMVNHWNRITQEPSMVDDDDDETSNEKEIDKLMALISLSFKKIYKPTNNNLRTSSNTSRSNQDNSQRIHRNAGYESQRGGNVAGARETVDAVDSGPIFDTEPEQKLVEIVLFIVDSGCSKHMTGNLKLLINFVEKFLELLQKCECLETELSKSKMMSKSFESVQKHAINLELELQQCKEKIKNDMSFKVNKSKDFCKECEQYFGIQDLKAQLQDKGIVIITAQTLPTNKKPCLKNMNVLAPGMYKLHTDYTQARTSKPQLKSNPQGDRVMHNNSRGKKLKVEEHRRNVKLPKNKTSVTACNDSLNTKTLNVKSIFAMCEKCVLLDKHDMCALKSVAKPRKETIALESNKKPRNIVRKLYERLRKIYKWSYIKFIPSGYMWKPKSPT